MEIGDLVIWRKSENWPEFLVRDQKRLEKQHGEGPFKILNIIRVADTINIEFIDKNGKTVRFYSLWFEKVSP